MFLQQLANAPELKVSEMLNVAFRLGDYMTQLWNLFMVFSGIVVGWRFSAKEEWGAVQKAIAAALYAGFVVVNGLTLCRAYDWLNRALGDLQTASGSIKAQSPQMADALGVISTPVTGWVQASVYCVAAITVTFCILSDYPLPSAQTKKRRGK